MEIPLDTLSPTDAATVLLMAGPPPAVAPAAVSAGKNPKPAKRMYPLQRPGQFAPPPRNAVCHCGSGAKFKRCCGA